MKFLRLIRFTAVGCLAASSATATQILLEGESPASSEVTRHPWYEKVARDALSGGEYLAHFDPAKPGHASYSFAVEKSGEYHIWLRTNPVKSAMTWRLADNEWAPVPLDKAIDVKNIAADNSPDLRFLGWVDLGTSTLAAGTGRISFRFQKGSAPQFHGAIDRIVLTTDSGFRPPDSLPSGSAASGDPGSTRTFDSSDAWAFSTGDERSPAGSALDVGALLNERVAGSKGFVGLSKDRMSFVRGDGEPIRFWGVVSDGYKLKPDEMERHAAWLAKRGVNIVRIHAELCKAGKGAKVTDVDERTLDGILRWVAVCKKHGIYSAISPYWAFVKAPASWGIEGYVDEQPWGLLFFHPGLQEGYRAWARALYTTPNPYAGNVPLKDEPAVAIVQAQNEDSLLFWTFNAIKPAQRKVLGAQFFTWAQARYGSLEKAFSAWENASADGDDPQAGVLGFRNLYELTGKAPAAGPGMSQRRADQLEFLTETQRQFYSGLEEFYKKELGIRSLTNAMNWRSADQVTMDDAERYSYTPMDVSAVNYYTGGAHVGKNNGYRIDPGDKFTNSSVLRGTAPLPANLKQTLGHPMIVTETAWVNPNLYQSEGPFLMAAYQSLTGVDIAFWFAFPGSGSPEWAKDIRAPFWPVGDSFATFKWYGNHPMLAGQFPAFALAYRLGYIAEAGGPAVYEERSLQDLWQRRIPVISESGRFDPNRDAGVFARESPLRQEVTRSAFFVGPVISKFNGNAGSSRTADLAGFIDEKSGDIRSLTGQLVMNQKRGVATMNAPKVQGVCGFLREAGGTFPLGSTTWESTNDYAALVAVSLDGKALADSRRILVQAGTTARLSGFTVRDTMFKDEGREVAGEEIVSNGSPPWLVAKTHARLILNNPYISKATALDPNMVPLAGPPVKRVGGTAEIALPADTLYTILE